MANEKPPASSAPAAAPAEKTDAPKKKGSMKMVIVAAAVVLMEVGTVVLTVSLSSGPRSVTASVPTSAPAEKVEKDVEIKLISEQYPNTQSGKLWHYSLQVVLKVPEKNKEKVTDLFAQRESEIRDQIRTIVASSDTASLAEPGLETLRRKISYQLEQTMGKDLIKEVLIPKCTPSPGQ
jgi:flagellar basal body-associated protein FliL